MILNPQNHIHRNAFMINITINENWQPSIQDPNGKEEQKKLKNELEEMMVLARENSTQNTTVNSELITKKMTNLFAHKYFPHQYTMEVIGGNHSRACYQRLIDEMNRDDPQLTQILKDLPEKPFTGVTLRADNGTEIYNCVESVLFFNLCTYFFFFTLFFFLINGLIFIIKATECAQDVGFRNNITNEFHKMMTTLDKAKFIHRCFYQSSSFTGDMQHKPQHLKVINNSEASVVLMKNMFALSPAKLAALEEEQDKKKATAEQTVKEINKIYLMKKKQMNPLIRYLFKQHTFRYYFFKKLIYPFNRFFNMPKEAFAILKKILQYDPNIPLNTFKNRFVYLNVAGYLDTFNTVLNLYKQVSKINDSSKRKSELDKTRKKFRDLMSDAENQGLIAPTILHILQTDNECKNMENPDGSFKDCPWMLFKCGDQLIEYCKTNNISITSCVVSIPENIWKKRNQGSLVIFFWET